MTPEKLQDPTTKYPKPPFKGQEQPWPGLGGKMEPRPDHGEKSYKGSGRLAGRKALITGGDSGMGRAAAIAYAREGTDVSINSFPTEEPDAKEVIELVKQANLYVHRRDFGGGHPHVSSLRIVPIDCPVHEVHFDLVMACIHGVGAVSLIGPVGAHLAH